MRPASFLALLLFATIAHDVSAGPSGKDAKDEQTKQRPLIELSYLVAPERIDDFTLEDVHYDAANRYSGARFRYVLQDHQETRFDLFVYPAGRMPQAAAIESGMTEFKSGIEQAQKTGYYRDVQFADEESFPLFTDMAEPAAGGEKEARLVALVNASKPLGKRLRMHYVMLPDGFAMHSNGYLFYRQLFYYKVRVSAAQDRIDDAQFQSLADRAARALASSVNVFNQGGCLDRTIEIDPDAGPDAIAEALVRQTSRIEAENCIDKPDEEDFVRKKQGARVVTIEFSPDDWKAK